MEYGITKSWVNYSSTCPYCKCTVAFPREKPEGIIKCFACEQDYIAGDV